MRPRKVIRRGNFTSIDGRKSKINDLIVYFNKTMAKPFRWTYQATPLATRSKGLDIRLGVLVPIATNELGGSTEIE
jgi:hypothetical protein